MPDPIDEVEFLTRSENRIAILDTLREDSATRSSLQENLDLDRVTLGRILGEFEDRCWISIDGDVCSATFLGRIVADEFLAFREFMASTDGLRSLVGAVPVESLGFPAETLLDATTTTACDGDPYAPVRRFMDLLQNSGTLRGYDTSSIAPMYVDDIREEILGGMTTEIVYLPPVAEQLVSDYRDAVADAIESGYLVLSVADDLPFGLAIFDDRVAIGVYDDETGMLTVLVDTDDSTVRAWARASVADARADATPLKEWLDEPLP